VAEPTTGRRTARRAFPANWGGLGPLLLLLTAAAGLAQGLPAPLDARLRALETLDPRAAAKECDALGRQIDGIEPNAAPGASRRAGELDQLRAACVQKISWTDPTLVHIAERAVEARRPVRATEPAPLCAALRNLGLSYHYLSRLKEALKLYQEAVTVSRNFLGRGTTDEDLAASLEARSSLWLDQRKFAEARSDAAEALRLRRGAVPYRPEAELQALVAQARIEDEVDPQAAKAILERARPLALALGPEHRDEAGRVVFNLGTTLYRLGELNGARDRLQEAEELWSGGSGEAGSRPSPRLAAAQQFLGEVLYETGEYPRAIELHRKAVSGYRAWLGEEPFRYGDALTALAAVLEASGEWEEALALQRQALALREAAVGAAPTAEQGKLQLSLASSLTGLGALQRRMGSAEARASLERALAIEEGAAAGTANAERAETLLELADAWSEAGDVPRARSFVGRCLRELAALGEQGPLLLRATETAARLGGDPEAALRALDQARRKVGTTYGEQSLWAARLLQARAELRMQRHDVAGALGDALQAQQLSLPQVRSVVQAFPRNQALVFAGSRRRSFDLALRLASEQSDLPAATLSQVWQVAAASRMLVLDAEIERQRILSATKDPRLSARAGRLKAARERFAYLLVRNEGARGSRSDPIEGARRELRDAEREMIAKLPQLLPGTAASRVSLAALRRGLPAGAALVAFFQYRRGGAGDAYTAFVLGRSGPPHVVSLGPAVEIDWRIQQWREALLSSHGDAVSRRRAGEALRQAVWDPISRRLGDARSVFVVPDGGLHLVPLIGLPAQGGGYLVEQGWAFHTLTAERDLLTRGAAPGPGPWLAVGGVDYDRAAGQEAALARPGADVLRGGEPAAAAAWDSDGCANRPLPYFGALPGSLAEVEELKTLWRRLPAKPPKRRAPLTLLVGGEATKQALLRAVPGQRLVHLATHGFASAGPCTRVRPALRGVGSLVLAPAPAGGELEPSAGLVLAGANRLATAGPGERNGILTALEILDLDLHAADWVVLSACDSGLGTIRAGEGMVGILRAFQVAGAKTVIVSLWPVDDQAAQGWMRELYRARFEGHLSTIAALRQASLRGLRASRDRGDDNPARWAGFIATGQWH
jgi:CHAT domain-containing protein/tetratricopeptide (TPR) repeat protein